MTLRDALADVAERWLCQSWEFGDDVTAHALHQSGSDSLAAWVLSDPAFRAALVEAMAEALAPYELPDPWTDNLRAVLQLGTAPEVAAAIVARMMGEET